MLHKWIIPIVLFIGFIVAFPLTALSQKTLKLDLKKGLESLPLKSTLQSSQKLIRQMEFYNAKDNKELTMTLWYDKSGKVIKCKNVGYWKGSTLMGNVIVYYEVKGNTLVVSGCEINPQTEEPLTPKLDAAVCELNDIGLIVRQEVLDYGDGSEIYTYEYDLEGQTQAMLYNNEEWSRQNYDWEDGNILNGNGGSEEHYTYTSVLNNTGININKLFTQTYSEDIWQLALFGYIGKSDRNLIGGIDNFHTYEYTFGKDGYITTIKEYFKGKIISTVVISYDEIINPDPDPAPTPSNPTTEDELGGAIGDAPEGSEGNPTEIFIPSDGITLNKPLDIDKHIRLKGGKLIRGNDNSYAMLRIRSGYSLELDDITIDGNQLRQKDGSLIVYGKLKLKDGVSIKNCYRMEADAPSGAICVGQGGVLTMDGGTISGNTGAYGSAVYNEGTFTMTGGEISANSGQIGAVVNNAGGEFIMTGGKISSNKVTDGCGGVFVSENCSFIMTGGEISGNEDCALYTWSDLQIGGSAKVDGLTLLNDGNRLLVNPALRNNWQISYVDTPPAGTIVATGRNGYQLTTTDFQKIIYYNNTCQLKLSGNDIVTYQTGTAIDEINAELFRLSVSGNRVQVEGLPSRTSFIIYEIGGKTVSTHTTDNGGQCNFPLESGIYLLNCKDQTKKFMVK